MFLTRIAVSVSMGFLLCVGISTSAPAAVIDFTDATLFSAAQGEQSFEWTQADIGQVEMLAAPPPGTLGFDFTTPWHQGSGVGVDCESSSLFVSCSSWLDDPTEIDAREILTLRFESGPIVIDSFTVAGLSAFEWGSATGETFTRIFVGACDGRSVVQLGEKASWISFQAYKWSDYSLVSLSYSGGTSPIPEPNSAVLFAIGGVLVGGSVRRKLTRTNHG